MAERLQKETSKVPMLLEIVYSWSQLQSVNQAVHESGASESSVIAAYAFLRECSSDWVLRRSEHVKIGGRGLMGVQRNSPPLAVVSGPKLSSPKLSSATPKSTILLCVCVRLSAFSKLC